MAVVKLFVVVVMTIVAVALGSGWSYDDAEGDGPSTWYLVAPECGGRAQSPIDLRDSLAQPLSPEWMKLFSPISPMLPLRWENNGHTLMLTVSPLNMKLGGSVLSDLMDPIQIHFHTPSEHSLNGELVDMEMHFVTFSGNRDSLGSRFPIAVIGVFFQVGTQEDPFLAQLMPLLGLVTSKPSVANATIVPDLPDWGTEFWEYEGSLTTPPCTQTVHWMVSTKVITASAAQISAFEAIMGKNNRPVQGLFGRQLSRRTLTPGLMGQFTSQCGGSGGSTGGNCSGGSSTGSGSTTVLNFAGMLQGLTCKSP